VSFPVPKLRIRTDADLVTAVPYLIGFRPDDGSIVVLAFVDNRAVFAARADLPGQDFSGDVLLNLGGHLADVTRRAHPNAEIVVVGYGAAADHVDPALRAVADVFTTSRLVVRQLLRVADSRIFHLDCDHPGCPPDGTPFDSTSSPVVAEATLAGVVALPNRAAKAAQLAPSDTASGEAMRQAVTRATARLQPLIHDDAAVDEAAAALADAVSRHGTGRSLDDDEVAWLVVLLTRPSVWDLAIDHAWPDEQHIAFWTEITRRTPEVLVPAPATLLAVTAWRFGDGVTATLAAERALHVDPSHEFAGLMLDTVQAGITSAEVEGTLSDTDPESPADIGPRR
jgi:hypothetical protein